MKIRPAHYWRRRVLLAGPERFAALVCDPSGTIAMLSREPQKPVSWLSRFLAFLTTPFKFLGISGWKETGCQSEGKGRPVRDAQHSTDGFWTIDVALEEIAIGTNSVDLYPSRYLRLEVEPKTLAHDICAKNPIGPATKLAFAGAVVIDTDGPFLEIHPEQNFRIV